MEGAFIGTKNTWQTHSANFLANARNGVNTMKLRSTIAVLLGIAWLAGCASPPAAHHEEVDVWAGAPVAALDAQPFFNTLPMVRTNTAAGIEIRDYVDKRYVAGCLPTASANSKVFTMNFGMYKAFRACSENMIGCDNVFYIDKGVVAQFAPSGQCKASATLRPQGR